MMQDYFFYFLLLVTQAALLAVATDLLAGHAGRLGLSAVFFAGVGGYAYATLSALLDIGPNKAILLGIAACLLVARFLGELLLRLDPDEYLLATFALQVASIDLVRNLEPLGGALGITGVPVPQIGTFSVSSSAYALILALPVLVFSLGLLSTIVNSRTAVGRAYYTIRDDVISAHAAGMPVQKLLLFAFVLHSGISGIAGISMVISMGYVGPDSFSIWYSITILTVVFLGGTAGRFLFLLLGAAIVILSGEALAEIIRTPQLVGHFQLLLFNCVLVSLIIFRPRGIGGPPLAASPTEALNQ